LVTLDEALALVQSARAGLSMDEFYGLKGELLWQAGYRLQEVEACFRQAWTIAREQQAKSRELRAALRLSRLWQYRGQHLQARQLMSQIYNWFTEGFDTPDLQEAKRVLEALSRYPDLDPYNPAQMGRSMIHATHDAAAADSRLCP
jgi:hypothetical protein